MILSFTSNVFRRVPLLLFFALGFVFLVPKGHSAYYCDCDPYRGEYECQNGTYCCTGGGCPSWVCLQGGNKCWQGGLCCTAGSRRTNTCLESHTELVCTRRRVCEEDANGLMSCFYRTTCSNQVVCDRYLYIDTCEAGCTDISSGNSCRRCPTEPEDPPVGSCTMTPISGTISADTDANSYNLTDNVNFSWTAPTWGICCSSCGGAGFQLYVDGALVYSTGRTTLGYLTSSSSFGPGTHSWYVVASNGNAGSVQSPTQVFTVVDPAGVVEGYIWDATGLACSYSSKDSREIQTSDLTGTVIPTVDSQAGTWDPSLSGKSYTVPNVTQGANKVLCASLPAPQNKPGFKYSLSCLNNSSSGVFSTSCAYIDASSLPVRAELGYKLSSFGWYQVIDGDVFAGCSTCADSVSVGIPDSADILGGFGDNLIEGDGALFANSDISIKNPDGSDRITSNPGNEYYNKNMVDGDFWSSGFSFTPPSQAEEIRNNCSSAFTNGNLDPNRVYKADTSCVQAAIDGVNTNYRLARDGVVAVFVTDANTLTFSKNFKSESSNKRIIFITEGPVEISKDVGEAAPTDSTAANIQASIVSAESINFLSSGASDDTTVIMEGPLVAKSGNVDFTRDRGLQNGYPAQVVRYNPLYMTSSIWTDPALGLGAVTISWTVVN